MGLESGRLIGVGKKGEVGAEPALNRPGRAMSDEDLKAELERLRNENAALKKRGDFQRPDEGKRKGSSLDLWYGALSCNFVQRTVVEAAGHVRRHSRVCCCERRAIEEKGVS